MADPRDLVRKYAAEYGIDENVAMGLVSQESAWKPNAKSKAGAMGYTQLMPGTAKDLGVTDPYNPEQNIRAGMKYLSQMKNRYGGDINKALTAYNWGPGNMDHYLKTGRGKAGQAMPQEAVEYASRVLSKGGVDYDPREMAATQASSLRGGRQGVDLNGMMRSAGRS